MAGGLTGKVALVTGASSGIGEGIATALAAAGASVAVAARRADRLRGLVERVEALGGSALAIAGDMTVEAEAAAAVERTVEAFGRIDILVNSAGVMRTGGIVDCDTDEYRRVFDINLFATLYATVSAVRHMRARGQGGDVVNISSLAARKGGPLTSAYTASKHAVNAMTDGMRQELGGEGIRVCTLMPGATATEVGDTITDPNWRKAIQAHVGKEGAVQPSEIGDAVRFILEMPRHVNISEIVVRPTSDTTA